MVKHRNGKKSDELFIVEQIVDRRRDNSGTLQYLIKWKNYSSNFNTWENAANIAHCKDIINEFKEYRLGEGFVDSEEEVIAPSKNRKMTNNTEEATPKRRRRRRTKKASPVVEEEVPMEIEPMPGPSSVPQYTEPAMTVKTLQPIPVNPATARAVVAATFNENGKFFCVEFLSGQRYWISNDNCRIYFSQILIDFYEQMTVYVEPQRHPVIPMHQGVVEATELAMEEEEAKQAPGRKQQQRKTRKRGPNRQTRQRTMINHGNMEPGPEYEVVAQVIREVHEQSTLEGVNRRFTRSEPNSHRDPESVSVHMEEEEEEMHDEQEDEDESLDRSVEAPSVEPNDYTAYRPEHGHDGTDFLHTYATEHLHGGLMEGAAEFGDPEGHKSMPFDDVHLDGSSDGTVDNGLLSLA